VGHVITAAPGANWACEGVRTLSGQSTSIQGSFGYIHIYVYMYIYIHRERAREGEREREREL